MTLSAADQTRFLQALGDDPEFLHRVRQRILTADLLELPERFAEHATATNQHFARLEAALADFMESTHQRLRALEQGQDDLKADVGSLKADVGSLKADVGSLKADMVEVKTNINSVNERMDGMNRRMDRMDGRMDNGFGTNYEIKVANNFGSIAGRYLNLRRARVLKAGSVPIDGNLNDLIADAEDRGAITAGQANELLAVDLIAIGRSRDNGHDAYVAAEASITLGDQDIVRAAERAEYLGKATGQAAVGAVIGESVGSKQVELARQRNVTVMLLPAA